MDDRVPVRCKECRRLRDRWKEGAITGEGTTPGTLRRVSDKRWTVRSPANSEGHLWDTRDRANLKESGLYRFSCDVLFRAALRYSIVRSIPMIPKTANRRFVSRSFRGSAAIEGPRRGWRGDALPPGTRCMGRGVTARPRHGSSACCRGVFRAVA